MFSRSSHMAELKSEPLESWARLPTVLELLADMLAEPSADFRERVRAALGGGEL